MLLVILFSIFLSNPSDWGVHCLKYVNAFLPLFSFLRHSGRWEDILENCGMKERIYPLELKDKSEVQICYFLMGNFEQAISDPWIQ